MKSAACEQVYVRDSRPGLGKGLFANTSFEKGEYIVEYVGKKIPTKLADTLKTRYLFELDDEWTVDGEDASNIARYINHSCDPNAEGEVHDQHILIFASRSIERGEEITIDYGEEYFDEFIQPVGCKCSRCNVKSPSSTVEARPRRTSLPRRCLRT